MEWRLGKRLGALFLLVGFCLAAAQERHNFLGVNGELRDDAGPYYFIGHGDSSNAYARAGPLANAMGLSLSFDDATKTLIFRQGSTVARLQATADIAHGLVKRPDVLTLDGRNIDSPMGILVEGTAYVAITPIVEAFGGESDWHAGDRLITIETADRLPALIPPPRLGAPKANTTRVALDLPSGHPSNIAAGEKLLVIALPDARGDPITLTPSDPNLESVAFQQLGSDLVVVMRTRHPIDPTGLGFEIGRVGHPDREVLYVDFAPDLRGQAVEPLPTETPASAAPAARRTVVIDAGHGGHDPGTSSTFAIEEQVVLDIALKLRDLLVNEGIEVILTRDHDTYLTLKERSTYSTPDRNLFISIHANAAPSSQATGIETWVFGQPLNPGLINQAIRENGGGAAGEALTQEALASAEGIAGDILKEAQLNYSLTLAQLVQDRMIDATGARDRGVKANVFYVISTARIPAVLVEVGFVSNADEGRRLGHPELPRHAGRGPGQRDPGIPRQRGVAGQPLMARRHVSPAGGLPRQQPNALALPSSRCTSAPNTTTTPISSMNRNSAATS